MSCCGASVASQKQFSASQQGLTRVKYITADPNESGSHWRADWDKCKVIFNGQRVACNTIARASGDGWVEFYLFDVKTSQIGVQDGKPMVKREAGVVDVYVPSAYQLNIAERELAKQSQWWPKT